MKTCRNCEKDITGSHENRSFCSDSCVNKARYKRTGQRSTPEQRSEWYRNRTRNHSYIQKLREQGKNRYQRIKKFLAEYKISRGCKDCGYNKHHAALDFDHVSGNKELNVCFSKSEKQALKEIEKCEVVCSNCHRVRTFDRIHL